MQNDADELILKLAEFELDPYGFALWAFPWKEPGSPLENEELEEWQAELLQGIGEKLRKGVSLAEAMDGVIPPVRVQRSTGHGVGKSAVAAILTWWAMSTMVDTKGVVTANTETQLKTKTWPEIAKWHRMFIARELFDVTATAIFPKDPEHARTWRIDIVPWSEKNTEAFAGLHNMHRRIFVLMDEGSAIPDLIWEVAEGAMTDRWTQIVWAAFGNPTKNKGRFRENAPDGRFGLRWDYKALDSRGVRRTNKQQIEEWREDYGDDSDFFRVRVKGMFPRADMISFISYEAAVEASKRAVPEVNEADMVLGVDVARFGDDNSVIYPRRGRDARSFPIEVYSKMTTTNLALRVRDAVARYRPSAVFVDGTGIGAGVVDQLNDMNLPCLVIEVGFATSPDGYTDDKCANKRAEIWTLMRDWLKTGCTPEALPKLSHTLVDELTGPQYGYNAQDAIQLESKKDMKKRQVQSPDVADALACTFALPMIPIPRDMWGKEMMGPEIQPDYDPFEVMT